MTNMLIELNERYLIHGYTLTTVLTLMLLLGRGERGEMTDKLRGRESLRVHFLESSFRRQSLLRGLASPLTGDRF